MPTTAVSLDNLAQRIAQQESELEALRQEYEVRQARLADLARRKQELEGQLRQLEAEIEAVDRGEAVQSPPEPGTAPPAKAAALAPSVKPAKSQTLADFLVGLVRRAKGPLTARQLADEVVRCKFPTSSRNIPDMVKGQVSKLIAKGVLRRAKDQPGVVLAEGTGTPKPAAGKIGGGKRGAKKQPTPAKKPAKPSAAGRKQPALRDVLTDLLAQSKGPMPVRDLAAQAKAAGHRSKSKKFTNVV
jgi:hypothetical protein